MDGATHDRFEDVCAELNNSTAAVYGLASYLARKHAPEHSEGLRQEMERFKGLVAELRGLYLAR